MSRMLVALSMFAVLLVPGLARGFTPIVTPVKIERVKPKAEKIPTLRFFKENLDFLRSSLDGLNQIPLDHDGDTEVLSENLLRYREMMEALAAARDTVDGESALRESEALLTRVTELAELEAELDLLEEILAQQQGRLGELEDDFLNRRTTAVVVVLRGSHGVPQGGLEILDGFGEVTRVAFSESEKESLQQGGIVQVYHEFVEPRGQSWEVSRLEPDRSPAVSYLSFEPVRHRVNFLEIDLSPASAEAETDLEAQAWCHPDVPGMSQGGGSR